MPTLGSLFDGIGGFPLAAVRNGIEPVWASEIEAFPIEVTRKRFPSMLHVGDITKLNGALSQEAALVRISAWRGPEPVLPESVPACLWSRSAL